MSNNSRHNNTRGRNNNKVLAEKKDTHNTSSIMTASLTDQYKSLCPAHKLHQLPDLIRSSKGNELEIQRMIQSWWDTTAATTATATGSAGSGAEVWEDVIKRPHHNASSSQHRHPGRGGGGGRGSGGGGRGSREGRSGRSGRSGGGRGGGRGSREGHEQQRKREVVKSSSAAPVPVVSVPAPAPVVAAPPIVAAPAPAPSGGGGGGNVWATKGSAYLISTEKLRQQEQVTAANTTTAPVSVPVANVNAVEDVADSNVIVVPVEEEVAAVTVAVEPDVPDLSRMVLTDSPVANPAPVAAPATTTTAALDVPTPAAETAPPVAAAPKPILNLGRWSDAVTASNATPSSAFEFVFGSDENAAETTTEEPAASTPKDTNTAANVTNASASPSRPPPGLSLPPGANVLRVEDLEGALTEEKDPPKEASKATAGTDPAAVEVDMKTATTNPTVPPQATTVPVPTMPAGAHAGNPLYSNYPAGAAAYTNSDPYAAAAAMYPPYPPAMHQYTAYPSPYMNMMGYAAHHHHAMHGAVHPNMGMGGAPGYPQAQTQQSSQGDVNVNNATITANEDATNAKDAVNVNKNGPPQSHLGVGGVPPPDTVNTAGYAAAAAHHYYGMPMTAPGHNSSSYHPVHGHEADYLNGATTSGGAPGAGGVGSHSRANNYHHAMHGAHGHHPNQHPHSHSNNYHHNQHQHGGGSNKKHYYRGGGGGGNNSNSNSNSNRGGNQGGGGGAGGYGHYNYNHNPAATNFGYATAAAYGAAPLQDTAISEDQQRSWHPAQQPSANTAAHAHAAQQQQSLYPQQQQQQWGAGWQQ